MNAGEVRALLARHGLRPNRELGQNFLVDESLAARLVERAGVGPGDGVLEIGAGLGVLTRALAARARRVVALEVDRGLVRALREEGLPPNVELIHADALEADLAAHVADLGGDRGAGGALRCVANLPYSVASPLLRRLLDLRERLADWSVLLQKEVAARLLAAPGTRDYGSLGVLHQLCAELVRLGDLRPNCFFPAPRVTSTHVRIVPRREGGRLLGPGGEELVRVERVLRAAFATRRKRLANALRAGGFEGIDLEAVLAGQGVAPGARAESLPPEAWLPLARALAAARRAA